MTLAGRSPSLTSQKPREGVGNSKVPNRKTMTKLRQDKPGTIGSLLTMKEGLKVEASVPARSFVKITDGISILLTKVREA